MFKKPTVTVITILFISVNVLSIVCPAEQESENIPIIDFLAEPLIRPTDIRGLYYMSEQGPDPQRNDEGSLLKNPPVEDEETFCCSFVVFHFAEIGNYIGDIDISSIYYHMWYLKPTKPSSVGTIFNLGYSKSGDIDHIFNEFIEINTDNSISLVYDFGLISAVQYPENASFYGNEIYNFTIKTVGSFPTIRNNPDQHSFVILNLPDNETLMNSDTDSDGLSDYEELFSYFTNPIDMDTDNDGATDYDEVEAPSYLQSDPNDPDDITSWAPLRAIIAARSFTNHDPIGLLYIDLKAALNHIENRININYFIIEFDLSGPVSNVYSPDGTVTLIDSDTVRVNLTNPIPDQTWYTITLTGDAEDSFTIGYLKGDTDHDGIVSTADFLIIEPKFGKTPSNTPGQGLCDPKFDTDNDGIVSTADLSQVKPRFGNALS